MVFRHRLKRRSGSLTTYVACPKREHDGLPRTNHFYNCEKCVFLVKMLDDGVECDYLNFSYHSGR